MNAPLDDLLTALSGDDVVAEETFRRFEPLLRKVARRTLTAGLRARLDSEDVVQSVWAQLAAWFPGTPAGDSPAWTISGRSW